MKFWKLALCAAAASVAMGGAALADPAKPTVAFNAGVASNYLFRGLSQTSGGPEGFGGVDVTYGPVYVGTWLSNIDFNGPAGSGDTSAIEQDIYGGVTHGFGPVTLSLGGIYYAYWDQPSRPSGAGGDNYFELRAAASTTIDKVTAGIQYFHSWEFPLKTGAADYIEGDLAYAVTPKASLSGALGYQNLDKAKFGLNDYWTWNVGVTYTLTDHLSVDGRYVGVSSSAKNFFGSNQSYPFNAGDRIVGTLKATF